MAETDERQQLLGDTGFLLARASGLMVRATNARLAHHDLRARHFSVLSYVCDRDGASQRQLADFLGLDPSPVVALLDTLEAAGLIERRPHPSDRRARLIVPTPEGRTLRDKAKTDVVEAREQVLSCLTTRERELLLGMLRRVAFPETDQPDQTDQTEGEPS
ncbi:MarR family winged helix-turn-helix transcriptional regulator [Actinomadura sp. 3N407]|uniref:MarR family winged helix-turn-helix transcriptional regulator n=1 Tax=Actinomadura sp. 3N407 TaxID=3457423 RepID=UPI003FCE5585